jgi:hypothetical protein
MSASNVRPRISSVAMKSTPPVETDFVDDHMCGVGERFTASGVRTLSCIVGIPWRIFWSVPRRLGRDCRREPFPTSGDGVVPFGKKKGESVTATQLHQ